MARHERFINSLNFQFLTNTLELDLSNIFGKGMYPNKRDIHNFITDDMKVTAGMLRGVQHHPRFPKVHILFEKEDDLVVVEERMRNGLMMKAKNLKIFGYRCDHPMVTIVLNGQDMSIKEEEIARVMGKYGKVVTCERGRNNDLSTDDKFVTDGTWTVRMTPHIRTKPPETIYYFRLSGQVQTWILNFDGVGSSCVLCGLQGHMGFRCNSIIPRGGRLGRQPAGLGKWTDVVHELAPVVDAVPALPPPPPPLPPPGGPPGQAPEGGHDDDNRGPPVQPSTARTGPPAPGTPAPGTEPANDRNETFRQAQIAGGAVQKTTVKAAAKAGGLSSSQPAENAARLFAQLKNSQGGSVGKRVKDLVKLVEQNGWGNDLPVYNVASKQKTNIPGLPRKDQEWKTPGRRKGGKGKEKNSSDVSAAMSTYNRFGVRGFDPGLPSDSETEDEQSKNPMFARVSSASMSSYGSRRTVLMTDLLGVGKEQAGRKRNGSIVENKKKKKNKKNDDKPRKEEQLLGPDGVVPQGEVGQDQQLAEESGQNAASTQVAQDDNTNGEAATLEPELDSGAAKSMVEDPDRHLEVEVEHDQPVVVQTGQDAASSDVAAGVVEKGGVQTDKACTQPVAEKEDRFVDSQASHPLANQDDLELKEKSAKIKAALEAQKKPNSDEISTQQ